jgi:inner membrane protein
VAWRLIAIVDPVFTLALLVSLGVAMVKRRPRTAWVGLTFAGAYLLGGWVQQQRAEAFIVELADKRGHAAERTLVKPTLGNLLLWRTVYEADGNFYVDAVRMGVTGTRVYQGGSLPRVLPDRDLNALPRGSIAYGDALRFDVFAEGFSAWHPARDDVLGDLRYSMSPNGLIPLWGVELDARRPDARPPYRFFRRLSEDQRERFWLMLRGKDLD